MSIHLNDQYVKDAVRTEAPAKGMLGRLVCLSENYFASTGTPNEPGLDMVFYPGTVRHARIPIGVLNSRVHHCVLGTVTESNEILDLVDELTDWSRGNYPAAVATSYDQVCITRGEKAWTERLFSEIGDLFWYAACFVDATKWSMTETSIPFIDIGHCGLSTQALVLLGRDLRKTAARAADAQKKWMYYGKEVGPRDDIVRAYAIGVFLCEVFGRSVKQVKLDNIEKLERRFKLGKFSEELAKSHDSQ